MPPLDSPSSNTESTPTSNDDQVISKKRSQSISSGGRKKKRSLGVFLAHCDKVFTRSDHLARHNLNHEPKEVYVCDFVMDYHGSKVKMWQDFCKERFKGKTYQKALRIDEFGKESDGINNKALKKERKH